MPFLMFVYSRIDLANLSGIYSLHEMQSHHSSGKRSEDRIAITASECSIWPFAGVNPFVFFCRPPCCDYLRKHHYTATAASLGRGYLCWFGWSSAPALAMSQFEVPTTCWLHQRWMGPSVMVARDHTIIELVSKMRVFECGLRLAIWFPMS